MHALVVFCTLRYRRKVASGGSEAVCRGCLNWLATHTYARIRVIVMYLRISSTSMRGEDVLLTLAAFCDGEEGGYRNTIGAIYVDRTPPKISQSGRTNKRWRVHVLVSVGANGDGSNRWVQVFVKRPRWGQGPQPA